MFQTSLVAIREQFISMTTQDSVPLQSLLIRPVSSVPVTTGGLTKEQNIPTQEFKAGFFFLLHQNTIESDKCNESELVSSRLSK